MGSSGKLQTGPGYKARGTTGSSVAPSSVCRTCYEMTVRKIPASHRAPASFSLHSPRGDQEFVPRFLVEAADLDHGMPVGCGLDELAIADKHARVSDFLRGVSEKEEIARLELFAVDGNDAGPCGLLVGVAGHVDAAGAD